MFSAEHTHLVSEEITSINPLLSILQEIYACTLKYNIHTYILSFKWEKSDLSIMFSHYFVILFQNVWLLETELEAESKLNLCISLLFQLSFINKSSKL